MAKQRLPKLRFMTCGSVDDGKSTLIGRILLEQNLIPDDQIAALRRDSIKHGAGGGGVDLALLLDGLEAEREQGITIDVAYRYFATPRRSFIVADAPGHEQYTRNMATAATNADLAVLLVDARKGMLTQTFRHASIASLFGIKHAVLAVNKMDLVDFREDIFLEIQKRFCEFCAALNFTAIRAIPISAGSGINIATVSDKTPWYTGPSLLTHLEAVEIGFEAASGAFRMPVQWVNRSNQDFRGFCGTVARGSVEPGDTVCVGGAGQRSVVARIVTADGDLERAQAGDAVTLTLATEVDVARGDVLSSADNPVERAAQFQARVVWLSDGNLVPNRRYHFKINSRTVTGVITRIRYRMHVATQEHLSADVIAANDIAVVNLALDEEVCYERFDDNRELGSFIIIDRESNDTVAAGLIDFALRRSTNISWHLLSVDKQARSASKRQKPCILWFTGLSGSGKSTIAGLVDKSLHFLGHHTYLLDGDNVRHGLNRDLGFTEADRVENIRRVSEVAALFVDAGLIVLCSFISPYKADRQAAYERVGSEEFLEVFVDTPIGECRRRDPKGLYLKADSGQLKNFTGIDAPYERPEQPHIVLKTLDMSAEECSQVVIQALRHRGIIP